MSGSKVVGLGVCGAGSSVRSTLDISVQNGIFYVVVSDSESGMNRRLAKIALSPDRMEIVGKALVKLAIGETLDDIETEGFNRVTSVTK